METKNFNGKLIIALIMAGIIFAGYASATLDSTNVTLDKRFVQSGAAATYTFNISNNGPDDIFYIRIPVPSVFSSVSTLPVCPYDWTPGYSGGNITCAWSGGSNLTSGASAIVSFNATAPSLGADTTYPWNVTTSASGGLNATLNASMNTTVDATGPTGATLAVTGVTAVTGWLKGTVTVTCTGATDGSGSGVNASGYNYAYSLDNSAWVAISGTGCTTPSCSWNTAALNDLVSYVRCNATDNVSNTGSWSTVTYAGIDNTVPANGITFGIPLHNNGTVRYVNSSTSFTLDPTDTGGSGVNRTTYRNETSDWIIYSGPFNASAIGGPGNHTLYYNSTDNAGNTGSEATMLIYVDDVAPGVGAIAITLMHTNGVGTNFVSGTSNINATITDAEGSGVSSCSYTLNGGSAWVAANYTAINSTKGTCTATGIDTSLASSINMRANDTLSQIGTGSAILVTPDTAAPGVTLIGISTWQNTNATATIVCGDGEGSGCNASSYAYNVSASNPGTCPTSKAAYTLAAAINISSHQWVCAYAEDNVTNANVSSPAEFKVDEIAPTIGNNYGSNNSWVNSSQTVTLTPADLGDSGIKNVTYCLNSTGTICIPTTLLLSPYEIEFTNSQNTTVMYQTWDNASSNSSIGSFVVLIDETAPVASVLGASGSWQNTNATATATCSDSAGSGCNESSYMLYISTTNITTCPTGVGNYTSASPQNISQPSWVCSYVTDNVSNGNHSTTATEFKVDEIKPACSVSSITDLIGTEYVLGTIIYYNPSGANNGTFKVTVGATDSPSGIANVSFPVTVSSGGNVSVNQSGIYVKSYDWTNLSSSDYEGATVTCYDLAGNTNTSTFSVIKDSAAPTISLVTLNQSRIKQGGSINVTSDGTDAGSGIKNCYAYLSTDTSYDEDDVYLGDLGVNCNGSVTIPNPTEEGSYYIIVRPVDHVGIENTSASSALTVDNTGPTVVLTYSANPAKAGTVTITATYSENITSVPLISINQPGSTDISTVAMTNTSDNTTWTYPYTVNAHTGTTYIDGVANVSLSSVSDAAGNPAHAPTSVSFTIDTTAPTVALTYSANPAKAGTVTIMATYSEAVTSTPNVTVNQTGTTDIATAAMTNTSGNNKTWAYVYTVHAADGSTYIDGVANVSLSSVNDSAGNAAITPTNANFTIDTTAPTGYSLAVTDVTATTGWLGGGTVTVTCSDATDTFGVNTTGYNYAYSLEGSDWIAITDTDCTTSSCSWDTSELSDVTSWVRCRATDDAGNVGNWTNKSYAGIDNTAPVTTIIVGDPKYVDGSLTYVNASTLFNLSATDGASGVNETYYWFTSDLMMHASLYSGAFNASSEKGLGDRSLQYYSIDNASNEEDTKYLSIFVDDTGPTGSVIINDGLAYTSSLSASLALTYADNESGVDEVRYSNDGSDWTEWEAASATKAWTLTSGDGIKTVYYEVKDNVGNIAQFTDTISKYTLPVTTTTSATTTSTSATTTSTSATTTSTSATTTSTSTTSSTSSTSTTLSCTLAGDYPPCGTVTLGEVVAFINEWADDQASLADVVALINVWAASA